MGRRIDPELVSRMQDVLAIGYSVRKTAEACQVSTKTVERYLQDADFAEEVRRRKEKVVLTMQQQAAFDAAISAEEKETEIRTFINRQKKLGEAQIAFGTQMLTKAQQRFAELTPSEITPQLLPTIVATSQALIREGKDTVSQMSGLDILIADASQKDE